MTKDWKELHRKLIRAGYEIKRTGSNHWKVLDNSGHVVTVMPNSTSDHRCIRNKKAELKRLGIVLT